MGILQLKKHLHTEFTHHHKSHGEKYITLNSILPVLAEAFRQKKCLKFTVTLENVIKTISSRISYQRKQHVTMFHGQVLLVVYGNICLRDLSTLTLNLFGCFSLFLL